MQDPNIRPGLVLAGTLMLTALTGCGQPQASGPDNPEEPNVPTAETPALPGEWAYPLDGRGRWLSVGEVTGIRLVSGGETLSHLPARSEYLDRRSTDHGRLFVSYDSEQGRPLFVTTMDDQLTRLSQDRTFDEPIEGLCLYQDQALYLFLLSEQHRAHQFLVRRMDDQVHLLPVRSLPIPPESTDCAVDDATGTLYVAEAGVGVWAYGAGPEAELARRPVAMAEPFGTLTDGPVAIAATPGQLLILAGDRVVPALGDSPALVLEDAGAPETLTVNWQDDTARLAVFDEDRGEFRVADWTLSTPPGSANQTVPEVTARVETAPVPSAGDAADDPAIWVNPADPAASLVLGTNKRQGLHVYDLAGRETQSLPVGRLNNVDVRYGVPYQGDTVDIAVASNRTRNSLSLFAIRRQDGRVLPVTELPTDLEEIYGLCLYQPSPEEIFAFVNDKSGQYVQYRLDLDSEGWGGEPVREFQVDSQPEGCVADDQRGRLFVGEEGHGIWVIDASPDGGSSLNIVDTVGDYLTADVEGLSLYGDQYLVASSQGNNRYAVYQATPPYRPVGVFAIGPDYERRIDGVSETDGLAVSAANLGGPWSEGLLVVQDGRNVLPQQFQNFKLVPWQSIGQALGLPSPD